MWQIVQQETPDDYVLATGETHSVREFVELAFNEVGEQISWKGEGLDEQGINQQGMVRVKVDSRYFRPTEVEHLHGNPEKAKKILGWQHKTPFKTLVKEMVAEDLKNA